MQQTAAVPTRQAPEGDPRLVRLALESLIGGRMWAHGQSGVGATFYFTL